MKNSEIFIAAHKLAKTFEGNYQACFSLALKEIYANNKTVIFSCEKRTKYGCSKAQFQYMCSFDNIEMNIAMNRAFNYITKSQASELINLAKEGKQLQINA